MLGQELGFSRHSEQRLDLACGSVLFWYSLEAADTGHEDELGARSGLGTAKVYLEV